MKLKRKETWGKILYDTEEHVFKFNVNPEINSEPYPAQPLVLNVDLTFKCNMRCLHCVAHDMAKLLGGSENADLQVTKELIKNINESPFMVVVITGGEPLLKEYEKPLVKLIRGLKKKGIMVDTNGTIFPSAALITTMLENDVLLRVSWDIPHPKEEVKLRKYPKGMFKNDLECLHAKQAFIKYLIERKVKVAVQTVVHKYNFYNNNFFQFPYKLRELGVHNWYIQRFIPSHRMKHDALRTVSYEKRISEIAELATKLGIRCHHKRDKRHNSVFLLVKDGDLYTQHDEKPGGKIHLGKLGHIDYFAYVSAADHRDRYAA